MPYSKNLSENTCLTTALLQWITVRASWTGPLHSVKNVFLSVSKIS